MSLLWNIWRRDDEPVAGACKLTGLRTHWGNVPAEICSKPYTIIVAGCRTTTTRLPTFGVTFTICLDAAAFWPSATQQTQHFCLQYCNLDIESCRVTIANLCPRRLLAGCPAIIQKGPAQILFWQSAHCHPPLFVIPDHHTSALTSSTAPPLAPPRWSSHLDMNAAR